MDSKNHRIYDLLIIGGGASGLMAAVHLKTRDFLLLESNSSVGKKLAVCGGGYANITNKNLSCRNFLADQEFADQVLTNASREWLLEFCQKHKIDYELRKNGGYFCKEKASLLVEKLLNNIDHKKIRLNTKVLSITKPDQLFAVETTNGKFFSKNVFVATGSPSYPVLGSTSLALDFAKRFDHATKPFDPALVGFTLQPDQAWIKTLSGVSLPVVIKLAEKSIKNSMLFAHKGLSGPVVLNASLWWNRGTISIDFLPDFDLEKAIKTAGNKTAISLLPMPKSVIRAYLEAHQIPQIAISKLTANQRSKLLNLKNYTFAPAGTFGLTKAEVCKGGVLTKDINPQTLESKLISGLFFLGESLDVTGEVGGYNLQWAFSTAYLASQAIILKQ